MDVKQNFLIERWTESKYINISILREEKTKNKSKAITQFGALFHKQYPRKYEFYFYFALKRKGPSNEQSTKQSIGTFGLRGALQFSFAFFI